MRFVIYASTHVVGGAAGFWLIARLARSVISDRLFWLLTGVLSVGMWSYLLAKAPPSRIFLDFSKAYYAAGEAVLSGPEALRPLLEKGSEGFVNIPIIAYLFTPFAMLSDGAAGAVFLLLGVTVSLVAWVLLRRRYVLDRAESGLTLFALSAFGPLAYSMREGNTSHFLLLPLILGLTLAGARRDFAAGAAFATAALFKPPLALIGVYYLLRGRFRIVASAIALGGCVIALSLFVFGLDMHLLWLQEFAVYSREPMAGVNDQSIASALLRYERGVSSYLDWNHYSLSKAYYLLNIGVILFLAAVGLWAACRPMPTSSPLNEDIEPMMVLAFICVASTVSWIHYYVWLAPALALLFLASRRDPAARVLRICVWAAFALAAPALFLGVPLSRGIFGHNLSSVLVSYLLIAGLLIYALLIKLRLASSSLSQTNLPQTPLSQTDPAAAPVIPPSQSG